jgi:hypothetical protein
MRRAVETAADCRAYSGINQPFVDLNEIQVGSDHYRKRSARECNLHRLRWAAIPGCPPRMPDASFLVVGSRSCAHLI